MPTIHPNVPPTIYRKIIVWAEGNLFQETQEQDEAFLYIDGIDYYVLGQKIDSGKEYKITVLHTLSDLPVMLPSQVPGEVYLRLEQKEKSGWVRQLFPNENHCVRYFTDRDNETRSR